MELALSSQVRRTLNYLTDQISDLPVSAPLPAVWEIRKALGVSQLSVQKACDLLETQGRIVRKSRKGIFVADHTRTGEFAIVLLPELLSPSASPYYALACSALVEMVREQRPLVDVKMHFGKVDAASRHFQPPMDLVVPENAVKLRGVFSFHPLHEVGDVAENLNRLGIPVIMMRGIEQGGEGYSVAFDNKSSIQRYMTALAETGCRTVGVLGRVSFGADAYGPRFKLIMEAAQAAGLETRPEWMPVSTMVDAVTDKIGYEHFLHLWKLPNKPDGIIVLDDVACRGVLRGCLQFGVDLPGDLQLITHANKGVELPYHKPVTRIEFDAEQQARHAVDLTIKLLRGQTPEVKNILVSGNLVVGATTRKQVCDPSDEG